jgi:hypothetical protein
MINIAKHVARTALQNVDHIRWHGLGMLQIEVSETVRVHVWHRDLMRLPVESLQRVHDHRFSIFSIVVAGKIIDERWIVKPDLDSIAGLQGYREASLHHIQHAKIQTGDDDSKIIAAKCYVKPLARTIAFSGDHYNIPRRVFHTSYPPTNGAAVTVIERTDFDGEPARVIDESNVTETPSGIHGDWSIDEEKIVRDVIVEARGMLS